MSKAKKEAALKEIDLAKQENKEAYEAINAGYKELYSTKDSAAQTVRAVEVLVNSIRNKPYSFGKREQAVIKKNLKEYRKKEEIIRKEKQSNLAGAAVSISALGAGTVGALKLADFLAPAFEEKGISKKVIITILLCAVVVIVLIVFLLWKMGNRIFATKAALKVARKIRIDTNQIRAEHEKIKALGTEIRNLNTLIQKCLDEAKQFSGVSYKTIPESQRVELGSLVNNTCSLTQLINKQV